ncbi:hypothetical protein ZWY2020_043293 [Hordeum vulgare]|nr:hypothetical protein ZWY2020_043293 [Hordeum vulgare]
MLSSPKVFSSSAAAASRRSSLRGLLSSPAVFAACLLFGLAGFLAAAVSVAWDRRHRAPGGPCHRIARHAQGHGLRRDLHRVRLHRPPSFEQRGSPPIGRASLISWRRAEQRRGSGGESSRPKAEAWAVSVAAAIVLEMLQPPDALSSCAIGPVTLLDPAARQSNAKRALRCGRRS